MPDEVTLDVTTIEENVTVETTAGDVVEIQVVAPTGPTGATGPAGPNSVTSATTSDGTANLSLSNVSTATATVSSLLTANHIHGNLAGTLYTHVRTGEAMSKGDPFYISDFHVGSSQPIAMRADASDPLKMPAVGVMDANYAINTSSANGIISGTLSSVDTDGYSVNSPIYVANGGGYSNTAGTIPQQVGITERANANTGAFIVTNSKVISFADVSDAQTGTATLNLAGATIYPNGSITYASTNSGGAVGLSGQLATDFRNVKLPNASGNLALVASTTGQISFADVSDAETGTATLTLANAVLGNALIVGNGDTAKGRYDLFGNTSHLQWYSDSALYGERSFTITTENLTSSGEYVYKYPVGNGTLTLTGNTNGEPDKLTAGTISGATTFNATSYTYGTGAAAAHRTALGLTTLATTTPGTNVANFLEFPTSENLASAVSDETGSGSLVFATSPTLTTAIAKGAGTTTGTAFTVQNSSATVKAVIRDDGNYGVNGYIPSAHAPTSGYAGIWLDTSNCGMVGEVASGFRGINICANATRAAGSWTQQDTARNSFILSLGYEANNNGLNMYRAAAGSGANLVRILEVDASGNQSLAGTLTTVGPASSTARPMKFGSVTAITDVAMTALGFTSQQKIEINAVAYWVPLRTSAWT